MDIDEITDPYELQNKDNEWVETIAATRKMDKKNAKQNIKKEQKVQKKTYDRKVERNRSEFEEGDQVIVHNIKKAKRLPGTKEAKKILRPIFSREINTKPPLSTKISQQQSNKLPIQLSRKYYSRKQPEVTPTKNLTADITPTGFSISHAIEPFEETLTLEATEEIYEIPEQPRTEESLDATLSALKSQVLTALNNRTYLTSLHKTLAINAESLTSLKI